MSALCNQTMPLGFLEDELGDDLQSLMPGSPFDVLLGNQNVSVLDLSKDSHTLYNRPGGQPDAQDERRIRAESSKDAPGTRQLWEPFPSALLEQLPEFLSQQRDKGEAEASQSMDALLPIGLSSSSLPNMQPMRWPDSVRCNLAPVISLPEEVDRACLQARSLDQATDIRTVFKTHHSMPATSQSGETWAEEASAGSADPEPQERGLMTGHSRSMDRSSNLQQRGIAKRNRLKPRKRAETAQVAGLRDQVAELQARCSSMERELSNRSSGPAEAANEAVPGDSASVTHTAEPSQQSGQTPESGHVSHIGELSQQDLSKMSFQAFETMYKSHVSSIALTLGSLPQSRNQRAVEDLLQKSCDVLLFVMRSCMENSVVVKTWMMESFQAEQARLESEKGAESIWTSTAASLDLSANQKQAIVHLRQAFLERLGGLKTSRESIAKGLTGSVPSTFRNRISAVAALGAMKKIEAYVANIKACDRLICDFVSSILTQIFTPVQMSRCIVATYPYWPDMLALSTCIAASEGEASAIGLLDQELAAIHIGNSSLGEAEM